jgi:hypothetical protein
LEKIKFLPLGLFVSYFIKALIFSVSYPEAVILAVLAGAACFFLYKDSDSKLKELDQKLADNAKTLETKLETAIKSFELRVNEVESIKAQLNALKINTLTRNGFSQAK